MLLFLVLVISITVAYFTLCIDILDLKFGMLILTYLFYYLACRSDFFYICTSVTCPGVSI